LYRKGATNPAPEAAPEAEPGAGEGAEPGPGTAITAASVALSPEAQIATERYRCVCSCNDPLSVCTCVQKPGSIDMKEYVQELVDQKKTPAEIDRAMVERYGEGVLLSQPPPAPQGRAAVPPPAR
jgi:cytochrome c-type biogenesis protein CcmH/NrfF